jgi:metacaspase-1
MATVATAAPAAPAKKPQGLSLHLGLNLVNPKHYEGWDGELLACENDAVAMAALARSQGLRPTKLLTRKATRAATLKALRAAASALKAGDLFLLTFSGHGGQVKDMNGDEPDRKDETWCLYDAQLVDDELYLELSRFAKGVRVIVLSDSCHSGSVTRAGKPPRPAKSKSARSRLMPGDVGAQVYAAHQAFYDGIQAEVGTAAALARAAAKDDDPDAALAQVGLVGPAAQASRLIGRFKPAVVLISGCQDNQFSMDGDQNGAFTEQLLAVWDGGRFSGSTAAFHAQIRSRMPPSQSPNLYTLGPAAMLLQQRPFLLQAAVPAKPVKPRAARPPRP